nr:ABC transporter permease [Bacillus mediterraneensis]
MDLLLDGLEKALKMILEWDPEIIEITFRTLKVCTTAILVSTLLGVPAGVFLGLAHFPGRKFLLTLVNIGMGLPPVVAGLWITIFLWRSGPLGDLSLLYTPTAIILAQILVSFPIIAGLTASAFGQIDEKLVLQLRALGATKVQLLMILMKDARLALLAAIIAGFGRVIAEVGAAMMVGGNISGETRILTTTIVMEVSKGNFDTALALSFILMTLAFLVTFCLTYLQQRRRRP